MQFPSKTMRQFLCTLGYTFREGKHFTFRTIRTLSIGAVSSKYLIKVTYTHLLGVDKVQTGPLMGTTPVTSCCIPRGTIFALILTVYCLSLDSKERFNTVASLSMLED